MLDEVCPLAGPKRTLGAQLILLLSVDGLDVLAQARHIRRPVVTLLAQQVRGHRGGRQPEVVDDEYQKTLYVSLIYLHTIFVFSFYGNVSEHFESSHSDDFNKIMIRQMVMTNTRWENRQPCFYSSLVRLKSLLYVTMRDAPFIGCIFSHSTSLPL